MNAPTKMPIIMSPQPILRRWSFWLGVHAWAIIGFFIFFPGEALTVWNALPADIQQHVPKILGYDVGFIMVALSNLALFLNQTAVKQRIQAVINWLKLMGSAGAAAQKAALTGGAAAALAAAIALATPMIAHWEGRINDPYYDIGHIETVCDGHTGPDIEARHYSNAECDAILNKDVLKHAQPLLLCTPQLRDHVPQLAAFTSFNFNTGAYCGSTMARLVAVGDYKAACVQLSRWVYVKGQPVQGLVNRRADERALCERGMP